MSEQVSDPTVTKGKLSEEERERLLEQMRRELPELDRRYEKAIANLNRISRGLRPKT
jgi:polyhydroxyalkanoate synthesis regulator phasin